jgi:hypothetical protein
VSAAAWKAATDVGATAIIACTQKGTTARSISRFRPIVPVLGVTPSPRTARQLSVAWGITPMLAEERTTTDDIVWFAVKMAVDAGVAKKGDVVAVLVGWTVEPEPTTDTTAEATDEGGTTVAAATGVRTDVGETGTAEEDAAIAEGAAVDAVGEQSAAPTDDPEGGSELSGSQAAGAAPIDGYDAFTIAQLRGRLRGYQLATVADLLAYEEATRARAPFLTMLRNRLEKLEQQAADSSPLQPRGQ